MRPKLLLCRKKLITLSAVNGILFGLVAEVARQRLAQYQIQTYLNEDPPQHPSIHMQLADVQHWQVLPFQFMCMFIIAGLLVSKYHSKIPASSILIWPLIGIVAVLLFIGMSIIIGPYKMHILADASIYWLTYLILVILFNILWSEFLKRFF